VTNVVAATVNQAIARTICVVFGMLYFELGKNTTDVVLQLLIMAYLNLTQILLGDTIVGTGLKYSEMPLIPSVAHVSLRD
jgi:hypothetical protein